MKNYLFRNLLILLIMLFPLLNITVFSETQKSYIGISAKEVEMKMESAGINKESVDTFLKAMDAEEHEQIRDLLLKSIEQDKRNYYAYRALGNYYASEEYGNDLKKALEYYEKSFQINSDTPQAYSKLGKIYNKLGNYEKAQYYYNEIIKKFPKSEEGYLGISEVLASQGKNKGAEYYAERTVEALRREDLYDQRISEKRDFYAGAIAQNARVISNRSAEIEQQREMQSLKAAKAASREDIENIREKRIEKRKEEIHDMAYSAVPAAPIKYIAVPPAESVKESDEIIQLSYFKKRTDTMDTTNKGKDFIKQKNEAKAQMLLTLTYFNNNEYEKGFTSFYENYSKYADLLDDSLIAEMITKITDYNRKIKNTDRKLYEKNIKKFKELEIINNN